MALYGFRVLLVKAGWAEAVLVELVLPLREQQEQPILVVVVVVAHTLLALAEQVAQVSSSSRLDNKVRHE